MGVKYQYTSHENFSHDSIDSFGYDWERVANPGVKARYPFKIYLPQTTEDVVAAVREAIALGQRLKVRSKGHSSNDLVLEEGGSILCTEKMNRILAVDEQGLTATVQSGAALADIDEFLATRGLGLKIIGDHNHITAGGFASVGGISPASHRHGMFVDTILSLEYVNWSGEVVRCSKEEGREEFYRVITGLGQFGVITSMTLDIQRIRKFDTILRNHRTLYRERERFVEDALQFMGESDKYLMERGVWLDMGRLKVGQFSKYTDTPQTGIARLRNRIAYGYLRFLGRWAGRLPTRVDVAFKALGMLGIVLSPKYAKIKDVECFTDRVVDSSVGDPTRMLIILAPHDHFREIFHSLYKKAVQMREQHDCFTFVSLYVKAIRSPYLGRGDGSKIFSELMLYVGIKPEKLTDERLAEIVDHMDELCIHYSAFRYMHTKTTKDPARRRRIDPNAMYAVPAVPIVGGEPAASAPEA